MIRADAQRNRAKVLRAAETVLARDGLSASMRAVAELAGVGVGTIYRQFPTKEALYRAIVVDRVNRLAARAAELSGADDAGAAFFEFFTRIVEDATTKKVFVDALAGAGIDAKAGTPDLRGPIETLLVNAQRQGSVRPDVRMPEVLALLTAACLAAQQHTWDEPLRTRTLSVLFDGLRHPGAPLRPTGV